MAPAATGESFLLGRRGNERKEDLPLLQRHFVARFAAQYEKKMRGLTHRAQIRLSQHSWPGNVRELENVIGHAAMMTISDMVDVQDLPPYLQASSETAGQAAASPTGGTLAEMEREYIIRVLRETGGVISATATRLGVPRTTLNALMRKLGISRKDV
jgi:DNA-binding NtrC family response regulator